MGGLAILGIPMVRRLKLAHGDAMAVWPFETGFKALTEADLSGIDIVAAEVAAARIKAQPLPGEAKDAAQVRAVAEHFARLDETGKLEAQFAAPKGVSAEAIADARDEEGWILGS